jgi:hypothetical protein
MASFVVFFDVLSWNSATGGGCNLHSGWSMSITGMINGGRYLWHIYDMAMIVLIMMGFSLRLCYIRG